MKRYLTERVEPLSQKEKLVFILLTGFFVFLFMLFFQPFGVNNYDPDETITLDFFLIMALMGLVVSLIIGINEFLIYRLVIPRLPNRLQLILWIGWSVVWLASGTFLFYNYLGNFHDWVWSSWFEFIGNIGAMSLIPLAGILVYIRIRNLSSSLNARELQLFSNEEGEALLNFIAENEKDQFSIPLKYLLLIESEDNYVAVHYLKDEQVTKVLLRKSLKSLQEESHHPALVRCHRSYMVNLKHIREVKGNRKRMSITLENIEESIPVSRQYADQIYEVVINSPNYPK